MGVSLQSMEATNRMSSIPATSSIKTFRRWGSLQESWQSSWSGHSYLLRRFHHFSTSCQRSKGLAPRRQNLHNHPFLMSRFFRRQMRNWPKRVHHWKLKIRNSNRKLLEVTITSTISLWRPQRLFSEPTHITWLYPQSLLVIVTSYYPHHHHQTSPRKWLS